MKQIMLSWVFMALSACFVVAQVPAAVQQTPAEMFKFETLAHDFGDIKEEAGDVSYAFKFKNDGKAALTVTDVKASCGCTTPNWTKDKILPGKEGFVAASYAPLYRPGAFEKFVTVKARFDNETEDRVVVLTIKGKVIPRPKTIADFFPNKLGNLRLTTNHIGMGRLVPGKSSTGKLGVYNEGTKPITLKSFAGPAHITNTLKANTVLNPKDSVKFEVTFDGSKIQDWGFIYFMNTLATDDDADKDKVIYVSADIQEDFSKLTADEKAKQAHIAFTQGIKHNFGTIKAGTSVIHDFAFTNTGKTDLIIRKTTASCGCTATHPEKSILKPGESSSIQVKYDSTGKNGKEQKTVTVITNDPDQQTLYLTIEADVTPASGGTQ